MNSDSTILLIDDNDADAISIQRAFRKAGMANRIDRAERGEEGLDYLYCRGAFEQREPVNPGLILLDLNMPGMDGVEVLQNVRADEKLKMIPIVILTTSTHERDIETCYRSGANSFVQKPVDFEGLVEAVRRMKDYWFELVVLPRDEANSDH